MQYKAKVKPEMQVMTELKQQSENIFKQILLPVVSCAPEPQQCHFLLNNDLGTVTWVPSAPPLKSYCSDKHC